MWNKGVVYPKLGLFTQVQFFCVYCFDSTCGFIKIFKLQSTTLLIYHLLHTLDSGIDVGQGINIGPGTFGKMNKRRALNKHGAKKIWQKE